MLLSQQERRRMRATKKRQRFKDTNFGKMCFYSILGLLLCLVYRFMKPVMTLNLWWKG